MSNWKYDHHEVLRDTDGYWWHIANRYECRDTGERLYYLWDGTHTGDRYESADHLEGEMYRDEPPYESLGWTASVKPAAVNGYRVNGMLSEPENLPRWLGNSCVSDHDCPSCGEGTEQSADYVVSFADLNVEYVEIRCGACGETNELPE